MEEGLSPGGPVNSEHAEAWSHEKSTLECSKQSGKMDIYTQNTCSQLLHAHVVIIAMLQKNKYIAGYTTGDDVRIISSYRGTLFCGHP